MSDKVITMTEEQLKKIVKEAYAEGAKQLRKNLGLDDEDAAEDIKDLRSILQAYRTAKNVAWQTIIKYMTVAVITALMAGAYIQIRDH